MALIYGHALIGECSGIRNSRSEPSNEFTAQDVRSDLITILERCYIPEFMVNLINSLAPTSDPRRSGIQMIHSLAAFIFEYDYGRCYPITLFLSAHNLIADRPANQPPAQTLDEWYETPIIQNADGVALIKVKNLIGAKTPVGTYRSTIIQAMNTLFNPVTQRSNTTRPTFSTLDVFPHEETNLQNVNPYIYLLGADSNNVRTTTSFLQNMSVLIHTQLKCSKQLGSIFDLPTGISLSIHYYADMAFPTWYPPTTETKSDRCSITAYAKQLGFMVSKNDPKTQKVLRYPPSTQEKVIEEHIYLVNANKKDDLKDPDKYVLFNSDIHVEPDVIYFDPWDYTASNCTMNALNGIHIETNHISSFGVPQPQPMDALTNTNSVFLSSAVPMKYFVPALNIDATTPFTYWQRPPSRMRSQAVSKTLGNMGINRLPVFNQTMSEGPDALVATTGFIPQEGIPRFERGFNRLAFIHGSFDHGETPSNWPRKHFYAWSSYRYINTSLASSKENTSRFNFLLNFRTIYGTNVTMAKSKNPFLLIPKA